MTEEEQPFDDELPVNVKLAKLVSQGELSGTLDKIKKQVNSKQRVVTLNLAIGTEITEF